MGFVICEYEKLREEFPWFKEKMAQCEAALLNKARADWDSMAFRAPGLWPEGGEIGKSTVMPSLFLGMAGTVLPTWNQNLTALGHQTIMTGAAPGGSIYEDYKIGLVGLALLDKSIRITEIKMQISNKKLPRINIEEAMGYNKPAIVFEDYFILDEETGFDLYAYVEAIGPQRIKLIGVQANRVPNKLQVTNTGAALT